ncbi:MAG: DUF4838 domain-containing protein [Planctomycetia bacterium]|nr:DUF4838 domain-containing protein [Planctomycetia bacterium]
MKHLTMLWVLLGTVVPLFAEEVVLSREGKTDYGIVVAHDVVSQNAAKELQSVLGQVTGAEFPLVEKPGAKTLFVGETDAAKERFPEVDFTAFRADEIVLKTDAGGNILFAGKPGRGVLYSVVTFLEDFVGCRWWTAKEADIPNRPTLIVKAPEVRYAPKLICRDAYYRGAHEQMFAVHCRCNGGSCQITPEWGDHFRYLYGVHSFYPLIPPQKYFKEHPEWFSEIDGVRKVGIPGWAGKSKETEAFLASLSPEQRSDHGTQLCLTNEEMRRELVKNALEQLRKRPECNIISISQNDWHGYCTCEKCRAIDQANDSPSGTLITFVNQVAEEIEKEFPNVWVDTLAYQYTRKPPKLVRPRHNVIVRLCTIECSFLQPLETGMLNRSLKDDIEGWSQIAPQLFVWDYVTNFSHYLIPHPNMRVLPENIRFFVKNKTIGLFEQGDNFTTVGDFVDARAWVIAHLMWNPDADADALWKEFFDRFYGPAGPALQEYLKILHDAAEKTDYNLRCFLQNTAGWLDYETLKAADVAVQKARDAVKNDDRLRVRVDRALFAYDMNLLLRWHELSLHATLNGEKFWGPKNPYDAAEKLLAFAESQGTRAYRESWHDPNWTQYKDNLLNRFPKTPADAAKLPELERDWANTHWLDIQDASMNIYGREKGYGEKIDDPAASEGRAVKMPGNHFEWATSFSFPKGINAKIRKWHVWAVVRCDATATEGTAMTLGIYDWEAKKSVAHKVLNVDAIRGSAYRTIDLGTHELTGTMYLWFAPPKRPDDVQAVYVDRAFLIAEE